MRFRESTAIPESGDATEDDDEVDDEEEEDLELGEIFRSFPRPLIPLLLFLYNVAK